MHRQYDAPDEGRASAERRHGQDGVRMRWNANNDSPGSKVKYLDTAV